MFRLSCIVFAAGFVAPLAARAHGDLHDQIARARALVKLGEGEAAANDFTRAITRVPDPKPDYYLERAQALVSAADDEFRCR